MRTAAPVSRAMVVELPQPKSLPRTSAKTSRKRLTENVTKPTQSIWRDRRSSDLAIWVNVMRTAMTPMGTFTKKIQRQPMPLVIAPPMSGPMATAPPITAPYTPKAVPRSRPVNAAAIKANEVANMMAPPTPCTARARLSMRGVVDNPQTSEAAEKTMSPMAKILRRP